MAGYHIEQMAQLKYNEMVREMNSFLVDAEEADDELDYIMDKPYYSQRDVDRLISLRDDAYYRAKCLKEEIQNFLKEWDYCVVTQ